MRRNATYVILLLLASVFVPLTSAQVFKVQGGTSTMLNADGASVDFLAPNYQGSFGVGYFQDHFGVGGTFRSKYHGYTLIAGDDSVPFNLPTDLFDSSHYFMARGIGISRTTDKGNLFFMAGSTSLGLGTGFFQIAQSENKVGVLFMEHRLNRNLRLFSRNIVASRMTALQGLSWEPKKWLDASVSGGVGSNQPYAATAVEVHTTTFGVKASYVDAGSDFRRVTVTSPVSSEVNRENLEVAYQPFHAFSISAGHHNLLEPLTPTAPLSAASVNEVVTSATVSRLTFGAGLFNSEYAGRATNGTNLFAGRPIGSHLEVTGNYFQSHSEGGSASSVLSGTVRELFSQRFSLLQVMSRSNGQTMVAYGGEFLANRFKVNADYQNVYLPFRPDRPFQQALALNVSVRVRGALQVIGGTNVAPDGSLRYTFGASTFLYRERGLSMRQRDAASYSFPKYVVEGIVRDSDGSPLEGVAIHVGNELAYTDDTGHFQVRFRRRSPVPLHIAVEEFLIPGNFEIVHAPNIVEPDPQDHPVALTIVIRRIVATAAKSGSR
ncbi:MAG TPA: hypothetical protein VMT53_23525 [Terriglobales bacterium]|nr:hypothetical protein [Terriglobales bacterium]